MRTLITGGTLVGPLGAAPTDVLVDGETVAALLAPPATIALAGGGTARGEAATSGAGRPVVDVDRIIDATGKYVIPGGVDVHTHMELPFGGTAACDTFATGSAAAAWGGTTTIVDFAVQRTGEVVEEGLAAWHAKAEGQCAIDYGFHMIMGGVDEAALKAMDSLVAHEGVTSFKLFMAYPGVFFSDDGQILRAMQRAADSGATIMMHAENGLAIDVLVAQALARGDTDPIHHGLTRPPALEGEATHRASVLAQVAGNPPLYFVHLSASEALGVVSAARTAGRNVFAETCPQYLYLSLEEHLGAAGFEGAKYVASPPLRTNTAPHADDLWRGLRTDDLAVVSTDHCPFCFKEQKELGRGDFSKIPNGIGTVEHRIDLIYQGVVTGKISLQRWVETCATTPARMFGLYPRKGVIAPGSDADIVVYDPTATTTISAATHHMNLDHSAWEGFEIAGKVDTVLSRGSVVVSDGQFSGRAGHGRYVPRGLSQYLR
jgi:dihydropyrimidinase